MTANKTLEIKAQYYFNLAKAEENRNLEQAREHMSKAWLYNKILEKASQVEICDSQLTEMGVYGKYKERLQRRTINQHLTKEISKWVKSRRVI